MGRKGLFWLASFLEYNTRSEDALAGSGLGALLSLTFDTSTEFNISLGYDRLILVYPSFLSPTSASHHRDGQGIMGSGLNGRRVIEKGGHHLMIRRKWREGVERLLHVSMALTVRLLMEGR